MLQGEARYGGDALLETPVFVVPSGHLTGPVNQLYRQRASLREGDHRRQPMGSRGQLGYRLAVQDPATGNGASRLGLAFVPWHGRGGSLPAELTTLRE